MNFLIALTIVLIIYGYVWINLSFFESDMDTITHRSETRKNYLPSIFEDCDEWGVVLLYFIFLPAFLLRTGYVLILKFKNRNKTTGVSIPK